MSVYPLEIAERLEYIAETLETTTREIRDIRDTVAANRDDSFREGVVVRIKESAASYLAGGYSEFAGRYGVIVRRRNRKTYPIDREMWVVRVVGLQGHDCDGLAPNKDSVWVYPEDLVVANS